MHTRTNGSIHLRSHARTRSPSQTRTYPSPTHLARGFFGLARQVSQDLGESEREGGRAREGGMAVGREGGREGGRGGEHTRISADQGRHAKRSTRSDVHLLYVLYREGAPAQTCTNVCVGIDMCVCVCVRARAYEVYKQHAPRRIQTHTHTHTHTHHTHTHTHTHTQTQHTPRSHPSILSMSHTHTHKQNTHTRMEHGPRHQCH